MIAYDPKNWLGVLFRVRGSVLPRILGRVGAVAAMGALVVWLNHRYPKVKLPPIAHTLLGVALGLLLVFRTNASFDRWWEGRKLLGLMVNRCRDLARQIGAFIDGDDSAGERRELIRLIGAFYGTLRQYLRGERDLGLLGDRLTAGERAALEKTAVRPARVYAWISAHLVALARAGRLSEQRLQALDGNLTVWSDAWGGAERIMKTPIPLAYAQHIKAFLVLWCFTAPFAMVDAMGWLTPLAAAALGFAMFGIDEIGVEIEDPFGYDANDLPLDTIGEVIDRDVDDVLAAASGTGTWAPLQSKAPPAVV